MHNSKKEKQKGGILGNLDPHTASDLCSLNIEAAKIAAGRATDIVRSEETLASGGTGLHDELDMVTAAGGNQVEAEDVGDKERTSGSA